jgi:hypothetical protein
MIFDCSINGTIYRDIAILSKIALSPTTLSIATLVALLPSEIFMQLLHIDSAITGAQSVSRQLSRQVVDSYLHTLAHR